MNSPECETNSNKQRAIVHAYLTSNKSWIANDFKSDTKEPDLMEVDHTFKDKCKGKGKETKSDNPNKECFLCGKKGHFARTCWSRIHLDQMVNEVKGAKVDADAAEEFECTIDNTVKDVP